MKLLHEPVAVRRVTGRFCRMPQIRDTPLGRPEKVKRSAPSRNIFRAKFSVIPRAPEGENQNKIKETQMMKQTRRNRSLSLILCAVLIAAVALFASGCADNKTQNDPTPSGGGSTAAPTVLGEGKTVFSLTVRGTDKTEKQFEIHTDEATVGAALLKVGLIAGEDQGAGFYIKTVDGVTLDYNKDGKYWAFYENGSYAMTGADATKIVEGTAYALRAE